MTRMLRTVLLAAVLMAVAAPAALADSSTWETRKLNCSHGLMTFQMTFLVPPAFPYYAIVPFHDATSNAVLVPKTFHITAPTWEGGFSKPLAAKGGDRLVSCSYTDDAGLVIEIVGLLTPAS